jgi:hypothetical protein
MAGTCERSRKCSWPRFWKVPNYKWYFEEVGFVDIVEKQLTNSIISWARDPRMKMLGAWTKERCAFWVA